MKKVFIALLVAGLFVACGNKNTDAENTDSTATDSVVVEELVVETSAADSVAEKQRREEEDLYYKSLLFDAKIARRLPMSSEYNKHNRASLYNIITADEMAPGFGDSKHDKNARFLSDICK